MSGNGDGRRLADLPWVSWGTAMLAAYGLKLHYSRASVEDLAWILIPTARAVGWLRGETLELSPEAGWMAPDGSYYIAPACAGVNFMILVLTVSVLGFVHRMRTPGSRLAWWLAALSGAYLLTIVVNTARILAAVELYRAGSVFGLTPEQAHRLLGTVLYLGALWGVFVLLDRLTRRGHAPATLAAALLVPGAYLGMTLLVPLLNGSFRHAGGQSVEHGMMVSGVTIAALALFLLARRFPKRRRQDG